MKKLIKSKSLSTRLFYYFILFAATMLLLLWLFETAFLEWSYRIIRTHNVKEAARSIVETIQETNNDRRSYIDLKSRETNISTLVYEPATQKVVFRGNPAVINNLFREILDEDLLGIADNMNDSEELTRYIIQNDYTSSLRNYLSATPNGKLKAIVIILKAKVENHDYIIVSFGDVVPVNSTIQTLRVQLVIISIIFAISSFILSKMAAKRISQPISQINDDAKLMASGNYAITFSGKGYSEIEELSETLNNTVKQLKKVDSMSRQLVANVSHDLRTPLTMISGYGEIIRDVPGENTPENVQVIIDEANRLTTLVNNLLDISKLESDTMQLTLNNIQVGELLNNVINSYSRLNETKGISIKLEVEDPELYIRGDMIHLDQVFHNLINNAISHIGDDNMVFVKSKRHNNMVEFEVIDHGEGISESDIPYIWERYYKANKRNTHNRAGSGLGLAIVKRILEMHHAEYGVRTKINEGSDFWFRLPIITKEESK